MAFEHKSGLPNAFDRAAGQDDVKALVFYGQRPFIQSAELTEMQTAQRGVHNRMARLVAKDGDRVEHASAFVDTASGKVTLTAGSIYVLGDVFPVAEAELTGVPMVGRVDVGVRLQTAWITHEDDPSLLGLVPGSIAEGEPGAAREKQGLVWALADDAQTGDFFAVYTLQDGTILDQTGPAMLEPVMQQLAIYDRPHGHYVVKGCRVTGLGLKVGKQMFTVEEGEANISGFKRTRDAALRLSVLEDWDEGPVPGETHIYPGGASHTFAVDQAPIGAVTSILLTKEKTVVLTRGIANGQDALPDTAVIQIVSIAGYTQGADFQRVGNAVDWGLAGAEPAGGSTYSVTYRYRANVVADEVTDTTIKVSGGADGGDIIVSYTFKLPRVDLIGLREDGSAVYITGLSARSNPAPPIAPSDVLPLATVTNDWVGKPVVYNDATRAVPYVEMWRYFDRILDLDRLLQLERLQRGIDSREPVAKLGTFVDPFIDDTYRDEGTAQTGAVGGGILQLPIAITVHPLGLAGAVTLDYTEEVVTAQELKTGCVKINPYANFNPLPATLALNPAADFWTQQQTEWASSETINLTSTISMSRKEAFRGNATPIISSSETTELLGQRTEQAEFLREIPVAFTISGFGPGETLTALTFDSISVLPVLPLAANAGGVVAGTFDIPANVTAGTKTVSASGGSGRSATAQFTGSGEIDVQTMRRVTTITTQTVQIIDPQAQIFAVAEPRQLIGVDFHLCLIGDETNDLLVEQVTTDNGYPTTSVEAQAVVDMAGAALGWKQARYPLPAMAFSDRRYAFVIKTDDSDHSVSLGRLGDYDTDSEKYVSSSPYIVGPRFDSVNAETWTAHQNEALTFRMIAARYTSTTKVVELGTVDLVSCSDMQIRAVVELPSAACSVVFEIERSDGTIYKLLPFQLLQLTEHLTDTVRLRAVLTGTDKLSPVLYAPVELIAGNIAASGTYVSRAMTLGAAVRATAYFKAYMPGGAAVSMEYSIDNGPWTELPFVDAQALAYAMWTERKHNKTPLTGTTIRFRITVSGGPAARVQVGDFGAGIF